MSEEFIEDINDEPRFEPIRDKGFIGNDGFYAYTYEIYDCMWDHGQVGSDFKLFSGRNFVNLTGESAEELVVVLQDYIAKIKDCKVIITEATKKGDG